MRQPPAFFTVPLLVLVEEVKGKKEAKKRYDTGGGAGRQFGKVRFALRALRPRKENLCNKQRQDAIVVLEQWALGGMKRRKR